jgi:hypothetical protein
MLCPLAQRKSLTAPLLLLLLITTATANAQKDAALSEAVDMFGVHLAYPAHWKVASSDETGMFLVFPEAHPPAPEWASHGFAVEQFLPPKYTIEDYKLVLSADTKRIAHRMFDRLNDGGSAKILEEQTTSVAGVEAYAISYELNPPLKLIMKAKKETGLLVVLRPNGAENPHSFHFFAPQSEWDTYQPILFGIMNTVRIHQNGEQQVRNEKTESGRIPKAFGSVAPKPSTPLSAPSVSNPQWLAAASPLAPSVTPAVYIEPSQTLVRQIVQVEAGRFVPFNFPLVRGSALTAEFKVQGGTNHTIKVWLMDATNYQRYQAGQEFSYFEGTSGAVQKIANYTFPVSVTNIYYLVLDNSAALMLSRKVDLYVYAILPEPTQEQIDFGNKVNAMYQGLKTFFVFDDFQISVRHCGTENAFSNPNITLCTELVEALHDQNLDEAVSFVFFHELGHSMMRLWGLPTWDNEDVADEFATVFLIMGKQEGMALKAAQWWSSRTTEEEALAKLWIDDRHTVSPQRARNIIRWLNSDNDLVRRWMKVMVPNMQTQALHEMLADAYPQIDKDLVRGELGKREYAAQQTKH